MNIWINGGLIALGAVIMGVAWRQAMTFKPKLERRRHQHAWTVLVTLMGLFLFGYAMSLVLVIWGYLNLLASLTALIFALGACFVLYTVRLTVSLASELMDSSLDLEAQVAVRTFELRQARDAAEEASRAKGQFLANMSHEIRTPLNGILGAAELMRGVDLSFEAKEYLKIIATSGENLIRVIDDVLDFSKIEAGKLSLNPVSFDLSETLGHVVSLLDFKARDKQIDLRLDIRGLLPHYVRGDAVRLRQVLINLLDNAVKFTSKGSVTLRTIVHEVSAVGARLEFQVIDTGIGIAPDVQKRLFNPFTQADSSTTRRFGGTGLGLAISQKIVGLMGGEIAIDSVEGEGATFSFMAEFEIGEEGPATGHLSMITPEGQSVQRRVLLVEDDPINQLIAQRHLEVLGFEVQPVETGMAALELMATESFDVVLMDCQMPGLDGYETTRRLRRTEAETKSGRQLVIALTAHALKEEREKCLKAGMDDFLSKPFRQEELLALLDRWL